MSQCFYQQMADEMMESVGGQSAGMTRDELVAKLKREQPDVAAFQERVESAKRIIQLKLDELVQLMNSGGTLPSHLDLSAASSLLASSRKIE